MKHILPLTLLSIVFLTGCSTAFKSGQTPDDVYFSPGRDREDTYVKEDQKQAKQKEAYEEYISSQDDRYLRMKVSNRNRWNVLENFDYWYDSRYDFSSCYVNSGYNRYNSWNPTWNLGIRPGYGNNWGWSSPIYTLVKYTTPTFSNTSNTAGSNITAYKNRNYSNSNIGYKDAKSGNFIQANNSGSFGDLIKRVFTGGSSSNPNNNNSYDRPARTFNNSNPNVTAPSPSSNAGGNSGGFGSTGTSTGTGRGGKG